MNRPWTKVVVKLDSHARPVVLCLSGLDPTGGAGLQADIEALTAASVHALPVLTANTVQSTSNVEALIPTAADVIARQLEVLAGDCAIDAVKIGLIGAVEILDVIVNWLHRYRLPVVFDPVLRAGGGAELAGEALIAAMRERLFSQVTLLTPNAAEARRLVPNADSLRACGHALLGMGCANVLITGGDEPAQSVVNTWFAPGAEPLEFVWPRLPGPFHGAGCTLASAIAARLALGMEMPDALQQAQAWTQDALARAWRPGGGRPIPGRIIQRVC